MGKLKQKSAPYCLFILVFYLAEAIFLPYVVMYLTETGMTTAQASLAYSGMNIGAIIGGLGLAIVRIGPETQEGRWLVRWFCLPD